MYRKDGARELRSNQTEAEKILWEALRNRKLIYMKFRRQFPIERYFVDFFCFEKNLIIELDGEIHSFGDNAEYDLIRQTDLENMGYKVLRFKNYEVLNNLDHVLATIKKRIR